MEKSENAIQFRNIQQDTFDVITLLVKRYIQIYNNNMNVDNNSKIIKYQAQICFQVIEFSGIT